MAVPLNTGLQGQLRKLAVWMLGCPYLWGGGLDKGSLKWISQDLPHSTCRE